MRTGHTWWHSERVFMSMQEVVGTWEKGGWSQLVRDKVAKKIWHLRVVFRRYTNPGFEESLIL